MKYTSRVELLRAAADSIEMQEKAGIEPMFKSRRMIHQISTMYMDDRSMENDREFPLAVVEGKPVFVGDELYSPQGDKLKAEQYSNETSYLYCSEVGYHLTNWSWNPPKPKTVMVELLVEDAKNIVKFSDSMHLTMYGSQLDSVASACYKALENLK